MGFKSAFNGLNETTHVIKIFEKTVPRQVKAHLPLRTSGKGMRYVYSRILSGTRITDVKRRAE
jgi:primosomal replication protein N